MNCNRLMGDSSWDFRLFTRVSIIGIFFLKSYGTIIFQRFILIYIMWNLVVELEEILERIFGIRRLLVSKLQIAKNHITHER